jgi:uncharacterized protein YjbI with pentapeptide repeats
MIDFSILHRINPHPIWSGRIDDQGSEAFNLGEALTAALTDRVDLSCAKLAGAFLAERKFISIDLRFADLTDANLSKCHLSNICLYGAKLTGANFRGATLTGCDLRGVDASNADFYFGMLTGTDLFDSNFTQACFRLARLSVNGRCACFAHADFNTANMNGSSFHQADCSYACFDNTAILRSEFHSANFYKAKMGKAKIDPDLLRSLKREPPFKYERPKPILPPEIVADMTILGNPDLTISAIIKAFRISALSNHPDKGGSTERFRELADSKDRLIEYLSSHVS